MDEIFEQRCCRQEEAIDMTEVGRSRRRRHNKKFIRGSCRKSGRAYGGSGSIKITDDLHDWDDHWAVAGRRRRRLDDPDISLAARD